MHMYCIMCTHVCTCLYVVKIGFTVLDDTFGDGYLNGIFVQFDFMCMSSIYACVGERYAIISAIWGSLGESLPIDLPAALFPSPFTTNLHQHNIICTFCPFADISVFCARVGIHRRHALV